MVASGTRLLFLLGNATIAFVVTLVIERFDLLERASDRQLQGLLLMYGVLIGTGTGIAGGKAAPYLLLQALPVLFAAVFFAGRSRYWIAAGLAAEHTLVLAAFGSADPGYGLTVLALCLIVAHFGANVADVLRESLAANRALHSVLEVTNAAPETSELPSIGLAAAMSVVGWDAGAVIVREGDVLAVAATYGVPQWVVDSYRTSPMRADAPGLSSEVIRTGEAKYVPDVAAFLGADHPLARDGIVCMIGVPIPYHGENIGVLIMDSRTPRVPDDRELDRLRQVAEQLGLALGNMRAYLRESQVSENLRELNRRKDAFLATVSHELRTPATSIALAARTLRDSEARLGAEDRAYAHELLVRRSDELTALIESLLDEALADSDGLRLELGPLDWTADLARWVDTARRQTGRAIDLDVPREPVASMADRAKVERVVANLLSNAAKFSPANTPIACRLTADEAWVEVSVTDRGPGIAPADRERIFERFYQVAAHATREHGGFGIGLSLVRRFTEAHGGTVEVRGVLGAGSTFVVRFPRAIIAAPRTAGSAGARLSTG